MLDAPIHGEKHGETIDHRSTQQFAILDAGPSLFLDRRDFVAAERAAQWARQALIQ